MLTAVNARLNTSCQARPVSCLHMPMQVLVARSGYCSWAAVCTSLLTHVHATYLCPAALLLVSLALMQHGEFAAGAWGC